MGLSVVEDILRLVNDNSYNSELRRVLLSDAWFEKFVTNVYAWPLTTEQARITLRILSKIRHIVVDAGWASAQDVDRLLNTPRYRNPPTQSANIPREVRFLGDNLFGFRFKRNDNILEVLKAHSGEWDWISRLWTVPVTRTSIHPLMEVIRDNRFGFDDDVAEYLAQVMNSDEEPTTFTFDPTTGKIIAMVNDCEIIAQWVATNLKGTPV